MYCAVTLWRHFSNCLMFSICFKTFTICLINFIICNMVSPLYDYSAITAQYERAHKNDNKNAQAMAYNSDLYNYYMWLNQSDAEQKWYYEQSKHEEDLYNKYQSPAAQARQYEEAGINPALAGVGVGSMGSPTSHVGDAAPSTPAQTIPDDLTTADALNSLHTSVSNYFQGRQIESQIAKTDSETNFMNSSSQFRIMQEQQKYLNMLEESDNIREDTIYKRTLKETALDGLDRLRRLSTVYDDMAIGQANKYKQDARESDQRIAESQFRIEVGRDLNARENTLLSKTLQSMDSLISMQNKQGRVFDETAKKVSKDSELVAEEIIGRQLTNGEKAEIYDMVVEEAKGEHKVWQVHNEIDQGNAPLDAYFKRFGEYLFGKIKLGIGR